jgi:(2R)-3-sulfolactate dehydrogenase (NADP+)
MRLPVIERGRVRLRRSSHLIIREIFSPASPDQVTTAIVPACREWDTRCRGQGLRTGGAMHFEMIPADALQELGEAVLRAAGVSRNIAALVIEALVRADLDGIPSHGLSRIPYYAEHVRRGRVDGTVEPVIARRAASVVQIDACHGFSFPAIKTAVTAAANIAAETGIACISITRSHHGGALGHPVEDLARQGFVALMVSNSSANVAGPGGSRPLLGTNPIAVGCPRSGPMPLVIDVSMSVAARGKIVLAAKRGEPIPAGWALGPDGEPTTDPNVALDGTLQTIGGAKGASLALAVEILASALVGARFSHENTSCFHLDGPPFCCGQLILAIDPRRSGSGDFADRVEELCAAFLAEPGVRLPGGRRYRNRERLSRTGIPVPHSLLAELRKFAAADRDPYRRSLSLSTDSRRLSY